MCILVQGFSIKKSTHAANYDIFAVLEFFILELPGTLGPDACNFLLFCINDNKEFAPASPGAGPGKSLLILYLKQCGICSREPRGRIWQFLINFVLKTLRNLIPAAPGPDPGNFYVFAINNQEEFSAGSPGAGSLQFLFIFD